eukprot:2947888-Alexandrium_andersonii.AAC.1
MRSVPDGPSRRRAWARSEPDTRCESCVLRCVLGQACLCRIGLCVSSSSCCVSRAGRQLCFLRARSRPLTIA